MNFSHIVSGLTGFSIALFLVAFFTYNDDKFELGTESFEFNPKTDIFLSPVPQGN